MPAAEFHRHPDGYVYVRAADGTEYIDDNVNFVRDFSETLPPLPDGADDHIYTQGRRHAYMGDGNIIEGGPMPWDQGDRIIASVTDALAAQATRREAEPPERQPIAAPSGGIMFDHENRLRALEGKPAMLLDDFIKKVMGT